MAVNASWPISETANSATRIGCRLSHGGVPCGNCRRAGNGRYALSANHGTQYASTHGYMGSAAIDRLCTPESGAASTYTPIGRAPGRYSQNRCVTCVVSQLSARFDTNRAHATKSTALALPSRFDHRFSEVAQSLAGAVPAWSALRALRTVAPSRRHPPPDRPQRRQSSRRERRA
jgi:hypothetical protein